MRAATTVAGFLLGLGVAFGGGWGIGAAVGPVGDGPAEEAGHGEDAPDPAHADQGAHGAHGEGAMDAHEAHDSHDADDSGAEAPDGAGGLAVADDRHRLLLADTTLAPGRRELVLTIEGPDGRPVTDYEVAHEKELHLVVVRRDAGGFQHVHPVLDEATGRWRVPVVLEPGAWRVLADFVPAGGEPLTLGSDLLVPGSVPAPAESSETRTTTVDGYTVEVDGHLEAARLSPLTLRVTRGGEPVADLEPYLGAGGHLVALREGDLAYLHVHPEEQPAADGDIAFAAEVPAPGRHHLYLDFRHQGVVRTAHLVLDAH